MLIAGDLTENEGGALMLAVEQLRQLFARADQREWKFECDLQQGREREAPAIYIVSLLGKLDGEREPIEDVRRRLREEIRTMMNREARVFLCTVFRACEGDAPTIERIRRLNLLVAQLSHELDCGVIDFDRTFADIGARPLQTSYNLEGRPAREVAAYAIVKTLFAAGAFDDRIPAETVDQARALHDRAHRAVTTTA